MDKELLTKARQRYQNAYENYLETLIQYRSEKERYCKFKNQMYKMNMTVSERKWGYITFYLDTPEFEKYKSYATDSIHFSYELKEKEFMNQAEEEFEFYLNKKIKNTVFHKYADYAHDISRYFKKNYQINLAEVISEEDHTIVFKINDYDCKKEQEFLCAFEYDELITLTIKLFVKEVESKVQKFEKKFMI